MFSWVTVDRCGLQPNQSQLPANLQQDPLNGPFKPEYLIVLATYLGVRWDSVPFNFSLTTVSFKSIGWYGLPPSTAEVGGHIGTFASICDVFEAPRDGSIRWFVGFP